MVILKYTDKHLVISDLHLILIRNYSGYIEFSNSILYINSYIKS
jgi:hypothetical protein